MIFGCLDRILETLEEEKKDANRYIDDSFKSSSVRNIALKQKEQMYAHFSRQNLGFNV